MGKQRTAKRVVKGEEYFQKKLHACKVNLKRAIKKAKDFEVRKIVKRLKKAGQGGNSSDVSQLEEELQSAKDMDIENLWESLCNVGNEPELDDLCKSISKASGVVEQQEHVKEMLAKIEEVKNVAANEEQGHKEGKEDDECPKREISVRREAKQKGSRKQPDLPQTEKVAKKKKPKNRMGQRARQKLAEKVHGSKAKHKQMAVEKKKSRKEKEQEIPLHPSWAAKKKDTIKINLDAAPSAKKVVFD